MLKEGLFPGSSLLHGTGNQKEVPLPSPDLDSRGSELGFLATEKQNPRRTEVWSKALVVSTLLSALSKGGVGLKGQIQGPF